jgi:beta-N-acetylhexosaminidase
VGAAVGAGEDGRPAEGSDPVEARGEAAAERLGLRRQLGQLLVSSFDGAVMPEYIRRRLRAGETAGVILFSRNGGPAAHWRRLTGSLQRAAGGGALVMVDQEGGSVRTVSGAGPIASQPLQGGPAGVRRAARRGGRRLRSLGINVNLAPVADVALPGSVMATRAFAGDASAVAARTSASVRGLHDARVAATAKHFPGLGAAAVNTDDAPATITSTAGTLRGRDLPPFRAAVAEGVPLVMLSHALYPALDARRIASQSPAIVTRLLRGELGFGGVVVTDSLEAGAVLARSGVATAAERSLRAGADLILMTGSASWNDVFPRLLRRARESPALRRRIGESAARVLALKRLLR